MSRGLLAPSLAFLAGVALGLAPATPPPWLPAALLPAVIPRLSPLAFAAAGWLAAASVRADDRGAPEQPLQLEGYVVTPPETLGETVRFRLARPVGPRVELSAKPGLSPLALGDRVRLEARLWRPPGAANPGGRDRRAQLAAAGVAWMGKATSPVVRTTLPSPAAPIEVMRARFATACMRHLPHREAGLVRAIGAGDRGALDDDGRRSFARSGLAHILAVSGMHLVVVVFGTFRLLRAGALRWEWAAVRVDPGRLAALACLPLAGAYALATGASPPVLRAAVGAALVLGGTVLRREAEAASGLALAALVLLAAEPATALDPSFQLSFAAVGGLALWARPLRRLLPEVPTGPTPWRWRLLDGLAQGACATLAASIATAPVLAFHFRQLPILGLVANVAAIPIGSGLTVLATCAGLGASVHPLAAAPFLYAAWPLAWALRAVSDLAAAPAWGVLPVGSPGLLGALACAALALAAGRLRGRLRPLAAVASAACLLLPAPLRAAAARARGRLEVVFLSVGQGDAALLRLPDGSAVLVDAGGAVGEGPDPGEREVVPLLRDLGVRRLAAVFVSHPHPDHVLGLRAVLEAMPVEAAFGNGDLGEGPVAELLRRLRPVALRPGESWSRGGVRFQAVSGGTGVSTNDASLVLRVSYGRATFLFPGDVERGGEAEALRAGGLGADVVKVPHHGSSTSSSPPFVSATSPAFAVASLGAGNRFGFPRPEVVARWRASGAVVFRTDDGARRFVSDGARVWVASPEVMLDPLATLREVP